MHWYDITLIFALVLICGYFCASFWKAYKGKGETARKREIYHFQNIEEMLEYRTDILEPGDIAMIKSHHVRYVWSGHEWG